MEKKKKKNKKKAKTKTIKTIRLIGKRKERKGKGPYFSVQSSSAEAVIRGIVN